MTEITINVEALRQKVRAEIDAKRTLRRPDHMAEMVTAGIVEQMPDLGIAISRALQERDPASGVGE
jgi:hypothetical protein